MNKENQQTIKRAGCFEGEIADPEAKCVKSIECKLATDCIWTKVRTEVTGLGTMPEGRGKMLRST